MVHLAKKLARKPYMLAVSAVVIVLIAAGYLLLHSHFKRSATTIPSKTTAAEAKTSSPDKTSSNSGNSVNTSLSNTSDKTAVPLSDTILNDPTGTFVSNHHPAQNGSDNKEQSVCNTTPGATCYIQFTNGTITKKLDAQVGDPTGAAYWTWDVKDAGFSAGSWHVSAVASLNGQTKTADDVIPLVVQP